MHPFHSLRNLRELILPAIEAGAGKAGRKRQDVAVSVTAFAAATREEVDLARGRIAFFASTPSYRPVMEMHGWREVAQELSARAARGEWDEMPALITDEMLREFCVVADGQGLASALQEKYNGIADRLTLDTPFVPGERDGWWRTLSRYFS